jgi:serine/threonine protein kinase
MIADVGHTYKCDAWSIGILICEMIGGFTPFQSKEASNPRTIMEKCRQGKLNLPKNLVGNARDLVKQLLIDDPVLRLEISQIKQHQFFKGTDWSKIRMRQMDPPFVPNVEEQISEDFLRQPKKSMILSQYSSKKYSATGGTGGYK